MDGCYGFVGSIYKMRKAFLHRKTWTVSKATPSGQHNKGPLCATKFILRIGEFNILQELIFAIVKDWFFLLCD